MSDEGISDEGVSDEGISDEGVSDEGVSDEGISDDARSSFSNGAAVIEVIDVARCRNDAESSGYISLLMDEDEIFDTTEGRDEFIEDREDGDGFIEERRDEGDHTNPLSQNLSHQSGTASSSSISATF
jgi:hypothetical protein